MIHMLWWMWMILGITVYVAAGVTSMKYEYYSRQLDAKKSADGDLAICFFLWWLVVFDDPKRLMYPSLWLWPRFRREWPQLKAEKNYDEARRSEFRVSERKRDREFNNAELSNREVRRTIQHEKRMAEIRKSTEALNEHLLKTDHLELETPKEINAEESEFWCEAHSHWVEPKEQRWDCK